MRKPRALSSFISCVNLLPKHRALLLVHLRHFAHLVEAGLLAKRQRGIELCHELDLDPGRVPGYPLDRSTPLLEALRGERCLYLGLPQLLAWVNLPAQDIGDTAYLVEYIFGVVPSLVEPYKGLGYFLDGKELDDASEATPRSRALTNQRAEISDRYHLAVGRRLKQSPDTLRASIVYAS